MIVGFLAAVTPCLAEERVALVVGVAAYDSVTPLVNTEADAKAIGASLTDLGFKTEILTNPTDRDIFSALQAFAFRAEAADTAIIYYAGHGVEIRGKNFLLGRDIKAAKPSDIERAAPSLGDVLESVSRARKLRIIILDSCRADPFQGTAAANDDDLRIDVASTRQFGPATRSGGDVSTADAAAVTGGLAAPSPAQGTLVAYAAKHGTVALDGSGNHSPFAEALLKRMKDPELEVGMMFRMVRDDVLQETDNRQEPHIYGSLSGVPLFLARQGQAETGDWRRQWASVRADLTDQLAAMARDGDTRSLVALAYIEQNPNDPRYDPRQAFEHLRKAAAAGDPTGQFELARAYERGIGIDPDMAEALRWYRASADQGFADALNDLGWLYAQGADGLLRDERKSIDYFAKAAEKRHPEALFNYAAMIDDGKVPGRGRSEAGAYLYDSIRAGNEDAVRILTKNPKMFSAEAIQALQRRLREFDFYDGSIDGALGPRSNRGLQLAAGKSPDDPVPQQ
ncbi:caspase family protein [Jiella sonneratiae]|uniref:Caspase family protein n=1 Tax=Jiella sonneratiae TaxID=2816856 RepID=A0ABS3J807_9HYPH|nr:caspase family protein [Jiella sonneratiae]